VKFQLFVLPTVPGTMEEREKLRPIGRNNERFQMMIDEVRTLCSIADDAGFDCFSTTEHHFHSEGYEASVAPLLLYADLAARTKRIKFAPLALVLPAGDPLRAAEQIAYLDHLTKGRVYAGFARGYQQRWVNVLGQGVPVQAAPMDGSPVDQHNKQVHEEFIDIIYKAWDEDLLQYKGQFYQVPYPYEEGISGWPAVEWTRRFGAQGEIDEQGIIRGISVIPRPYQQPHPPAFQPFSVSESTIRHTAKVGVMPMILVSNPPDFTRLCHIYQEVAAENGRTLGLGHNVGAFRAIAFGNTREEGLALIEKTNFFGFNAYFAGFGFWEAFRFAEDDAKYPRDPYTPLPPSEWTLDRFVNVKYGLAGTVDDIKRAIDDVHSIHGEGGDLEWFSWFFDQGLMPMDEARRQIELFAEHIIPEFR
jgi:alkanesulfonate monooxygenase SsuD/methylene tetrahydromethanopterin reductase-like flavin-dependent oxidoreductase (luciferase family)